MAPFLKKELFSRDFQEGRWPIQAKNGPLRSENVPVVGSSQPNLVVSNLGVCNFYEEALFCALCALLRPLRSFADLCLRCFALICALLRVSASKCV